jgi:hypothetical protein
MEPSQKDKITRYKRKLLMAAGVCGFGFVANLLFYLGSPESLYLTTAALNLICAGVALNFYVNAGESA